MAAKMADSKRWLAITEKFMNRFGSNLNRMRRIKCLKINIEKFQNGGQDGEQDVRLLYV